jgi:hypothetical protein
MSEYTNLLKNIEKLQELGFKSEFDLNPYLLSVEEVAKKILKQKIPKLSLDDIDMIIDSESISLDKMNKQIEEEFKKLNPESSKLTAEEKALRREEQRIEREKRKQLRTERIKKTKEIYKDKVVELKSQAKKIIKDIKIGFYNLIRESKTVLKKVITAFVQTGSSIGAISIIIAAPPWNIPLAISYTMSVVDILLSLVSQLKSIVPYTLIFDQLHFVVDKKNLSILSKIININVNLILGVWSKVTGFEILIKKLIDFIIKLLSGSNKQKIFRKVTSKLRKLGNFNRNNSDYTIDGVKVKANNEDDAQEAKDFIDTYVVDYGRKRVTEYKNESDKSFDPEQLLKQLSNEINKSQVVEIPEVIEDSFLTTYDVTLPDGTILRNQTEEDLEELKRVYKLVLEQVEGIVST